MKLLIVSGRSGSGKTTALHVLEDLGFYCVDNLPLALLPELAATLRSQAASVKQLAVGVDARNIPGELANFPTVIGQVHKLGIPVEILFLDSRDDVLLARFSATRRKHPLSNRERPLQEAIELERTLLEPLSSRAGLRLDTSELNVHELRDSLRSRLAGHEDEGMTVLLESFAFKHGVPLDADFVFDVRCLPNPHWKPSLRALTGQDQAVQAFLEQDELVEAMYTDIRTFLLKWLPRFSDNDRSYMAVAIGCTGGQHRSVYLVERLAQGLQAALPYIQVRHRDLPEKNKSTEPA